MGWKIEEDELLEFLEEVNKKMPTDEQIEVKSEYKKMKVVNRLNKLVELSEKDAEKAHSEADKLLIDYIFSINHDRDIDFAFSKIKKWYA